MAENEAKLTEPEIPESNKITFGLYMMPKEAYAMWKANSDQIHIFDVRTFEEYCLPINSKDYS